MERQTTRAVYDLLKRWLDVIGATTGLIISAPILVSAALLIKLDGGPVLFVQTRLGRNGKPFGMLKFRTMVPGAHRMESHVRREHVTNGGYGVPGEYSDPRITKVGSVLRLLNVDELPQLVNVLKGEMSLIGPRPVPYDESLLFGSRREEILSVRPGLTGYWQVKRRMSMDYDQRVELDSYYVRKRSLLLDAYVLLATPISMLTSDYNSVTKPLPPPTDSILISNRAVIASETTSGVGHETSLIESKPEDARH